MRYLRALPILFAVAMVPPLLADSFTLDNDTDIIDSFLRSDLASTNYGDEDYFFTYNEGEIIIKYIASFSNLNDSLGAGQEIDSAFFYFYVGNGPDGGNAIEGYMVWKNRWSEDTVAWDKWAESCGWGEGGCGSFDDDGFFNTTCDSDPDKKGTYDDAIYGFSGNGYYRLDVTNTIATAYDSAEIASVVLETPVEWGGIYIQTRENAGNKPYLTIYYSEAGAGPEGLIPRRRIIIQER